MVSIPERLKGRCLLLWLLLLVLGAGPAAAQQPTDWQTFTDVRTGFRLAYPHGWQVQEEPGGGVSFYAGTSRATAEAAVQLRSRPLPAGRVNQDPLAADPLDSLWQAVLARPGAQVVQLTQHDAGSYQELRYEYLLPDSTGRTRVLGRQLWQGGYEWVVEYRAATAQDAVRQPAARRLVDSFTFVEPGRPSRRYADQRCDGKLYGIAALRVHNGIWEDDCRSLHEWPNADLSAAPIVHRRVLPFQSYALAKGLDNCLYSVTKSPTDQPERVYRYNPATRRGEYTGWELPAQGPGNVWISAATDPHGNLYFQTNDGDLLVRVSPATDSVVTVWATDPLRQAAYYPAIGFARAGTHANFGLDATGRLYEVYSTDGALLTVDLPTRRPGPELLPLDGLPEQGGYSDLLLLPDTAGTPRLLLAGPKSVFRVDLARRQATRVRRGVYTDLAGCPPRPALPAAPAPVPAAPATGMWLGRVLDAATLQPLPQAQLHLLEAGALPATRPLTAAGEFVLSGPAGQVYQVRVQAAGYFPADTAYQLPAGPSGHDLVLRPLLPGAILRLDNVQFEQGKAVLLPSAIPDLDRLLALLVASPQLTIELRGHTDNQGDAQLNVQLSEQRVEVITSYLISHGVAPERITGRGLGGAEPRASNEQEATRRLNRRVEFRVTGGR